VLLLLTWPCSLLAPKQKACYRFHYSLSTYTFLVTVITELPKHGWDIPASVDKSPQRLALITWCISSLFWDACPCPFCQHDYFLQSSILASSFHIQLMCFPSFSHVTDPMYCKRYYSEYVTGPYIHISQYGTRRGCYKTQLLTGKIISVSAIMTLCQRWRKLDIIQFILSFGTTSQ